MRELDKRFPPLEHLTWARFESGRGAHRLSSSQVIPPPPEVFDPTGTMPLVVDEELRSGWIERLADRYGVRPDEVTLTAGVSEAIYTAAAALVEPGDVVLVERPTYRSLAAVPASLGAEVRRLERGTEGGLDPERAGETIARAASEAKGAGRRLAAVFLSDLHNPTGTRLAEAALDVVAGACRSHGATVVIDEVYRDADPERSIGTARGRHPDVVTLASLTKAYGMGGLRAGWILAPRDRTRGFTHVQGFLSVQPSAPSMALAARALDRADAILAWARELLEANRARFRDVIQRRPGGFRVGPQSPVATIAFPYRADGSDTLAECRQWLQDYDVEAVPGSFFEAPAGVRIGLGTEPAAFARAIEVWARAAEECAAPAAGAATNETNSFRSTTR